MISRQGAKQFRYGLTPWRLGEDWVRAWVRWLPVIVLLLAFALRAYKLGDQNVWWDEAFSVWVTRHDLGTLTTIAAGDTHPPLYYWLLNLWMVVTGPSEFALRFPSLVYGVVAVTL